MVLLPPLTLMLPPVPSKELGSMKTNTMRRGKAEMALHHVTSTLVASWPLSPKKDNFRHPRPSGSNQHVRRLCNCNVGACRPHLRRLLTVMAP